MIQKDKYSLVWSFMLTAENEANTDTEKKLKIARWIKKSCKYVSYKKNIEKKAIVLQKISSIHAKDAIHIACAIYAGCDYFITTDSRLLKSDSIIQEITIINPTQFIEITEGEYNEDR